jgi:PAS domain S-box-containing protein
MTRKLDQTIGPSDPVTQRKTTAPEIVHAHVALLGADGVIQTINGSWGAFATEATFPGRDCGLGQNYLEACDRTEGEGGQDARKIAAGVRLVVSGERSYFTIDRASQLSGEPRWFRVVATPFGPGSCSGTLVIHLDITETILAQERLREERERLHLAISAAAFGVWEWNLASDRLLWDEQMYAFYELTPGSEVDYRLWASKVHPDDLAEQERALRAVAADGARGVREFRIVLGDGRVRVMHARETLLRDGRGNPSSVIGVNVDVTERREREAQLAEQSALLDKAKDAIFLSDLDDRVLYWNGAAERMYGWSRQAAIGSTVYALMCAPDRDAIRAATKAVVEKGEWSGRLKKQTNAGLVITVESNWTLIEEPGGARKILRIDTNIMDRLDLEQQLARAQRLEAVGQLTGGVAHDFNNLLTVILGNAELLEEDLAGRPDLEILAAMTRTAAEQAARLTSQLLSFSRRQPLDPKPVEVNALIDGMDGLLHRALGEHIEVKTIYGAHVWRALIDAAQLESAVLNLSINARDAMPKGGVLTIETTNVHLDETYAEQQTELAPGPYVVVAVSDTGSGMTEDTIARAFEPFFTTKEVGQGSGLGLSMVYGFAKQSRGHVRIYSEVGYGTTVKLYLPRVHDDLTEPAAAADITPLAPKGAGKVLVVEDEALVRRHATSQLEKLGYEVVGCANALEALDMLRQVDDFDLLFTDIIMPGKVNGQQLAEHAVLIRPALRILFTSGYTETALFHHGRLDAGIHFLSKPYRRHELAVKVREALEGLQRETS